jgi:hypothetical protein
MALAETVTMRIPLRHCDMTGVALAHSRGGDGADHKFNCAHRSQGSDATGVALTQSGRRKRWPKPERCAYGSQGTATCQARHLRTVGGATAVAETVSGCIPLRHSDMTGVALAHSWGGDSGGRNLTRAHSVRPLRRGRYGTCTQPGGPGAGRNHSRCAHSLRLEGLGTSVMRRKPRWAARWPLGCSLAAGELIPMLSHQWCRWCSFCKRGLGNS